MMWPMAARLALVLLAVPVIGWLGFSYRSVEHQEEAEAILREPLASYLATNRRPAVRSARLRAAADHLERAERLNPDSLLDLDRGGLELIAGSERQAQRTFRSVVEREPENLQAWLALASATERSDRTESREALRRADRLNPMRSGSR